MNSMLDGDGDFLRRRRPTVMRKTPDSVQPEGEDSLEVADRKGQVNCRRACPCTGDPAPAGAPWASAELFREEDEMLSWLDYALGDGDGDGGLLDGDSGPYGHFPMTRGPPATGRVPATSAAGGKVGAGTSWSSGVFGDGGAGGKEAPFSDDLTPEARGADNSDDDDFNSEDGEQEGGDEEESRRPTSRKKPRTAEVHNLSERRRRNRINEKMKALQQLIPRCNNKSNKASVLDDAIEYIKSLQMQLQMTSAAACGMAPVVYVPPTGMAVVNVGSSSGSFNRAVLPFLPVMPASAVLPAGAPPFRAPGSAVPSEETMPRAGSQQDSAPSRRRACPAAPTTTPAANHADPRRRRRQHGAALRRSRAHAQGVQRGRPPVCSGSSAYQSLVHEW